MKRIRRAICIGAMLLFLKGASGSWAQSIPQSVSGNNDPCFFYPHSIAAVTCTSGNTITPITKVNNEGIFVCGIQFQGSGGTAQFEYGAGNTCTSPTNLTGVLASSVNINILSGATQWTVPAAASGNALCVVCGTSSVGVGHLTYVQPPNP